MRPTISVCIVTFNHAPYVRQCVESVLSQAGDFDLEVLVGDDQSTDATTEELERLAKEHPGRIDWLRQPQRLGGSRNLLSLVARARGGFIAHLDGDDYWLPGKLAAQLAMLEAGPELVAAYCNAQVVDPEGRPIGLFNNPLGDRFDLEGVVVRGNFLNHSSLLYRSRFRDCLLALPPPALDYRFHVALAQCGDLAYCRRPLAVYRSASPGSVIRRDNAGIRERYWAALESIPVGLLSPRARRRMCADFLRRVAFRAIATREGGLFPAWWRRVRPLGGSAPLLAVSTLSAILAEASRQLAGWLVVRMHGPEHRIHYHR